MCCYNLCKSFSNGFLCRIHTKSEFSLITALIIGPPELMTIKRNHLVKKSLSF